LVYVLKGQIERCGEWNRKKKEESRRQRDKKGTLRNHDEW
jgi:hypothetical protein